MNRFALSTTATLVLTAAFATSAVANNAWRAESNSPVVTEPADAPRGNLELENRGERSRYNPAQGACVNCGE